MTAPRSATVLSMMLPHHGRPVASCAPSSTSSAARTGADEARASYQPPEEAADTDAAAQTGRAGNRALLQPGVDPSARSRRVGSDRRDQAPQRHSIVTPGQQRLSKAAEGLRRMRNPRPGQTFAANAVTPSVALEMT